MAIKTTAKRNLKTEDADCKEEDKFYSSHGFPSQQIISGVRKECIELLIRITVLKIVITSFANPFQWLKIIKALDQKRRSISGESRVKKIAKVDGKYFWDMYIPGWPSQAFNDFFKGEINRILALKYEANRFTTIYLAITKKCPLQCEHCYEWDALNGKEKLTVDHLRQIVKTFQDRGISQIQLSGGEPMLKVNEIIEILGSAQSGTQFWVLTSGFNLTFTNAMKLKKSGLTGVAISLDHFHPEKHNQFRNFKSSYEWVEKAVANSIAAGLTTTLTICVTNEFISEENLITYMRLAKKMGVSFVQILEPRAVGHFAGKDVELIPEEERMLENFYLKMNIDRKFWDFPIISYHGYHQRRSGCMAAANRSLYVDTDGDLHACPFCQSKMGNALSPHFEESLDQLQSMGCHGFQSTKL